MRVEPFREDIPAQKALDFCNLPFSKKEKIREKQETIRFLFVDYLGTKIEVNWGKKIIT